MVVINYQKKYHKKIIHACILALKQGKIVAYPTDTSYGLAVDSTNIKAIKKLYQTKGRNFNKPSSLIMPSRSYSAKTVRWSPTASKLAKRFWPGALTLVLGLRAKGVGLRKLSAGTGFIGLRLPKNEIALDLAHNLGRPITATSANVAGQKDCYSAAQVVSQFKSQKYKPDIIINAGNLPKRKPSTLVKVSGNKTEILRFGPVSESQIKLAIVESKK